jgi:hypothetical protein
MTKQVVIPPIRWIKTPPRGPLPALYERETKSCAQRLEFAYGWQKSLEAHGREGALPNFSDEKQ